MSISDCFHLAVILSRSMHVVINDKILFFFVAEWSRLGVCVCRSVCALLSVDGHLGCFCILAVVKNAEMNTGA